MISFFNYRLNKFAVYLATICFTFGTLLFLLHTAVNAKIFIGAGLMFVVISVIVNSITLVLLLGNSIINSKDFKEHSIAIVMILMNIPVALFYLNNLNI